MAFFIFIISHISIQRDYNSKISQLQAVFTNGNYCDTNRNKITQYGLHFAVKTLNICIYSNKIMIYGEKNMKT